MNIILAEAAEVVDRQLTLTDYRSEHIVKVLRSEIGDRLRVGLINGLRGYGTILALQKKFPFSVVLDLDLSEPPGDLPPLDLILALPRPIMLKRVLSQVTALGIGTIHLINANRVETVAVPRVVGQLQAEAEATLIQAKLQPRVVQSNGANDNTVGRVTSQTPLDSTVSIGTEVTIEVNVGPAKAAIPAGLVGQGRNRRGGARHAGRTGPGLVVRPDEHGAPPRGRARRRPGRRPRRRHRRRC